MLVLESNGLISLFCSQNKNKIALYLHLQLNTFEILLEGLCKIFLSFLLSISEANGVEEECSLAFLFSLYNFLLNTNKYKNCKQFNKDPEAANAFTCIRRLHQHLLLSHIARRKHNAI